MPFHFNFSPEMILWTLTFAALLVLLVVLIGRERVRRFPWFTASIVMAAFRLLASHLLIGRLAPMTSSEFFIALAFLEALVALGVVVELARRAFRGAGQRARIIGTLVSVAVAAGVLAAWGPWPAWKTLMVASVVAVLRLMQFAAQRLDMLSDLLCFELGLLVVLFGRRFKAGWHSHTQRIVIGLSTAAAAQLAVRGIWEAIALKVTVHSQAEYLHVMSLQQKLLNANTAVYLAVLFWWIGCLWIDEPGTWNASASGQISEPAAAADAVDAPHTT